MLFTLSLASPRSSEYTHLPPGHWILADLLWCDFPLPRLFPSCASAALRRVPDSPCAGRHVERPEGEVPVQPASVDDKTVGALASGRHECSNKNCADDAEEDVDATDTSVLDASTVSEDGNAHVDSDSHAQDNVESQPLEVTADTVVETSILPQEVNTASEDATAPSVDTAPQQEVAATPAPSETTANEPSQQTTEIAQQQRGAAEQDDDDAPYEPEPAEEESIVVAQRETHAAGEAAPVYPPQQPQHPLLGLIPEKPVMPSIPYPAMNAPLSSAVPVMQFQPTPYTAASVVQVRRTNSAELPRANLDQTT